MSETKTIEQHEYEALEVLSELAHQDSPGPQDGTRLEAAVEILKHVQFVAGNKSYREMNGMVANEE